MTDTIPFLTEIDSRAEVKGTRDPLGLVAIWSRFGRRVVGNLTTVATSQRDFTLRVLASGSSIACQDASLAAGVLRARRPADARGA